MAIYALGDRVPKIHPTAWIAEEATIIGDVTIGANSTVWPGAVLRGDDRPITVGDRTSIQDGAVIHVTDEYHTEIGNDCVIGHLAHIEGGIIHDNALVGTAAIVLRDAVVESWAIVGAGALVPGRKVVPSGALALGVPATIHEGRADRDEIIDACGKYIKRSGYYPTDLRRIDR